MEDEGKVELRAGGWFAVYKWRDWSGPWRTEEAAELARQGKYDDAHKANKLMRG